MCSMFGMSSLLNFCSSPFSIICGMKVPVGTTMSKPLVPFAATSFEMSSSFELKELSVIFGPSSFVNDSSTSGAS